MTRSAIGSPPSPRRSPSITQYSLPGEDWAVGAFWAKELRERPRTAALLALLLGTILGLGIAFLSPLIVLTGLLGIAAGLAVLARLELGVLAFVAVANLLPFAVIPIDVFGVHFTLVDVVLTTILVAWLFWAIWRGRPLADSALQGPILLYLGLAIVSFVLGLTYTISPERLRLFLKSVNAILFFFSVLNSVRTKGSLARVISALILGGVAAAVIALVILYLPEATALQFLTTLGPLGYPTGPDVLRPVADTDTLRAIGTSIDPNVLGGLLMTCSALLVAQILSARPILDRRLLFPAAAVVFAALLLTQSRNAFGGLLIGLMMIATLKDRRLWLVLLAAGLALPLLPQASGFADRLVSGLTFQDRAAAMRLGEYRDAVNLIAMYPWFGIGFGDPPSIDLYLGVSNIYLLIGQEMGLVGLASFLAVLATLAWLVASGLRTVVDEEIRGMLVGLGAALLAAAAAGMLDHYFVNILFPHMIALFWLYVALAAGAVRLATEGLDAEG